MHILNLVSIVVCCLIVLSKMTDVVFNSNNVKWAFVSYYDLSENISSVFLLNKMLLLGLVCCAQSVLPVCL